MSDHSNAASWSARRARLGRPLRVAVVPCAGQGSRAGTAQPKQYVPVRGRAVVHWTLQVLLETPSIDAVLVVLSPHDEGFESAVAPALRERLVVSRTGGATRAESVQAGLQAAREQGLQDDDWVLVHDAARCLVQPEAIERLVQACESDAVGGLLGLPLPDTLKREDGQGRVQATVSRDQMWQAQTPQMFRRGLLHRALQEAKAAGAAITDEASALERLGLQPRLITGDADNFKVTYAADFTRAEQALAQRHREDRNAQSTRLAQSGQSAHSAQSGQSAHSAQELPMIMPLLRVGEGWDVHALVPGRALVLGGVTLPHGMGLLGHSDADALLHAVTDALLGAAGLGDIGRHFPDTDPALAGADSKVLLQRAAQAVQAAGWTVVNLDTTVIAQAPRLAPHVPAMRASIAACLGVDPAVVNVKAKTAEKMGPVGEGRAIEARAVCLLAQAPPSGTNT